MGVTIIATLQGLSGLLIATSAIAQPIIWLIGRVRPDSSFNLVADIIQLLLGIVAMGLAIGMLYLRNWAWRGELIFQTISGVLQLFLALILVIQARLPDMVTLLFAVFTIVYLSRPKIKAAFSR